MMKNFLTMILSIFLLAFSLNLHGQPFKGEEAAVVKAIEDDIRYFDQRDYDKWAAMWVHEPYVLDTWIGPGGYGETVGWENVDKGGKTFMRNNPEPVPTHFTGKDFTFLIKGDLAIVEYTDQSQRFTRVLEKRDGTWKMVRIQRLQSGGYTTNALLNQMKALEGKWTLAPGSVVMKSQGWKVGQVTCNIESTSAGLRLLLHYRAINSAGNPLEAREELTVAMNSSDQQMLATRIWHSANSGQNEVSTGNCQQDADGKLVLTTTSIDGSAGQARHVIQPVAGGKLAMEVVFYPGESREGGFSYSLVRE